jgi:hypothetical protein
MARVDVEELPPAEELWWALAVLAAAHAAHGRRGYRLDPEQSVLHRRHPSGAWFRMQRLGPRRAVLWGHDPESSVPASPWGEVLDTVPEWVVTDAVAASLAEEVGFLAWFAHDEWETTNALPEDGSEFLLKAMREPDALGRRLRLLDLTADTGALGRVFHEATRGELRESTLSALLPGAGHHARGVAVLRDAHGSADLQAQARMRARLHEQLRGQMRDAPEREQMLPRRPAMLVRWVHIASPPYPFDYVVHVESGQLVPASARTTLPEQHRRTLHALLEQCYREESGQESGGWLFARVSYDGHQAALDRAFDGWPPWYDAQGAGPSLAGLAWEMRQRAARWRPAWAQLVPDAD